MGGATRHNFYAPWLMDCYTRTSARNLWVTLYSAGWSKKRGKPCLRKEYQQITMVVSEYVEMADVGVQVETVEADQ